ncbi:MAG: hypothetical protein GX256_06330 [Fretibacterium sp.]|nr:hypothetical protein [Fretibacterium sp.]
MKDNKVKILGTLFFLFCLLFIGGSWHLGSLLRALQEEFDDLEQRRVDLSGSTRSLMQQKATFTSAFKDLEHYHINVAPSDMAFYSDVQQVVQSNGIEILSTRQQGTDKEGRSSIVLALRGDYYAMMQVLADWRNLSTTVRVASLSLSSHSMPSEPAANPAEQNWIQADVTLEAVIGLQR